MGNNVKHNAHWHSGLLSVFFAVVITSLAEWVLTINGLGPIDDHQFIRTLFQGKSFGAYVSPEVGRFFPLTAQEFVFASWLFAPSPTLFFAINAIKVIVLGFVLHRCLALTKINVLSIAVLWCVILFSTGFANAICRLHVGELNILLLTLFFVWSTLSIGSAGQQRSMFEHIVDVAGVVALVSAFFYKELVFVFAISFGTSELIRHYRVTHNIAQTRVWGIIVFGLCYIAGYSIWRTLYSSGSYADFHALSTIDIVLLFSRNDPFIIFIVLPLTSLRLLLIIRDATRHTIYDSFLAAASAYTAAFIALGMYNTYYLLPAYGFAVCGVAGILAIPSANIIYKRVILSVASVFCANTLPVALADLQSLHLIANNHYRFVHALSEWIWKNPKDNQRPRNIVLVGVTPGNGVEVMISLTTFLVSLGTPESSFLVIATEATDNRKISNFYKFGNTGGYKPVKNDLLVYNPYQNVVIRPPLLSPSYHEVLRSESEWALPRWSLGEWLRNYLRDPNEFKSILAEQMKYAGYAAMLLDRPVVQGTVRHLQSTSYKIGLIGLHPRMRAGVTSQFEVLIQNSGQEQWPSNGTLDPGMFVNISYRWFNADNQMILEGKGSPTPEAMSPHDIAKVTLLLATPNKAGKYRLVISPVQEGVQWFPGVESHEIEIY